MTTAKSTQSRRRNSGTTKTEDSPTLEVVGDETQEQGQEQEQAKRSKIHRDLSPAGLGMIGGVEDADPDAVPASGKAVDVSYLFPPLEASYQVGKWKAQVVTDPDAAERALRLAAAKLGYGLKVRTEAVTYEDENGNSVDATRVYFKAGTKITRSRTTASQGE